MAGKSITVARIVGRVTITLPGTTGAVRLTTRSTVPSGSEIDATFGRVRLTQAIRNRPRQRAQVSQGRFLVRLTRSRGSTLRLSEPLTCTTSGLRARSSAAESQHKRKRKRRRKLWVTDRGGSWTTDGRYAAATAKGTRWLVEDTCTRTTITVREGTVEVRPKNGRPRFDLSAPNRRTVRAR